ncbi:MAG: hypothetical protein KAK04_09430, partial [Cyclobacteriaceae bacterium]|nr:hypothetical protein [Cyclobacteriaceae bacterium]
MVRSVGNNILVGLAILFGVIVIAIGVFYIENHMVDDSMLPVRDPNELFSDTHFQDSILQHTMKGEYFVMVKKYVEFMIVNGRDRYGKVHS